MIINTFKKNIIVTILCLCSALSFSQTAPTDQPDSISTPRKVLGDPAPPLTIEKWFKGQPITKMEKGKVYVVEFWATWCMPCILGMPHMSDLAKKNKDVSFIGITVSEKNEADSAKAREFVNVSGKMMDYNVAYARPKGTMWEDWLQATRQRGIPVAYVIDKKGRIAWQGHPLMGLEEAIELAKKDKLTMEVAEDIHKTWKARQEEGNRDNEALKIALKENRLKDALMLNDRMLENLPFNIAIASGKKYALLTAIDTKAARKYGEELLKKYGNAPLVLKSVANTIFEGSDSRVQGEVKVNIKGEPDYKLAKALLLQSLECSTKDNKTAGLLDRIASK